MKMWAMSGWLLIQPVSGRVGYVLFQAEDGIRDYDVTGVQTCALPISDNVGHGQKYTAYLPKDRKLFKEAFANFLTPSMDQQ